nr:amidohydrolase family protein [Enterococcus sp.]
VDWMAIKPAEIFGLNAGRLTIGGPADLAIFDLETEYVVDDQQFLSKSINTPFVGWKLYGDTTVTLVDGKITWKKVGNNR